MIPTKEQTKILRDEYARHGFRHRLIEEKGSVCVNCGSTNHVEYHHIVPLCLGGTNNFGNIVPLCYDCHRHAHGSDKVTKINSEYKTGRKPRTPPKGYEKLIELYVTGRIGTKELKHKLGLSSGNKIQDIKYINEHLLDNGIEKVKNKVDLAERFSERFDAYKVREVSIVKYADGKTRIYYNNSTYIDE